MYNVVPFGERETEHFFTPIKNVDNGLFKVLLKHRRFIYGCPAPEEMRTTEGWHFKIDDTLKRPGIFHRIYEIESQQPVIEDYTKRIIRLPCLCAEKQSEVWLITPGCSGLFFFYGGKPKSIEYYHKEIDEYLRDVFRKIPGVTVEGNDLLINNAKAAGTEIFHNAEYQTLLVTVGITYDATVVKQYAATFDYSKKKYKALAGFNETGISGADFDREMQNFYEAVGCL